MADKRIQQYPEKVAPSTSDYLLVADAEDVDVNGYLKYKKVKISSLDNIVITNAEDITLTAINTLISTNALVIGRFYRITNSVSGVNPILVQAVALNVLSDIGISSVNGTVYNYDISTDTVSVPYAGVYVPYTGATTNVDLGEYQIKVGQLELDQTPTGTFGVGKIRWNNTDGTPEVMLKGGNVTLQIGQEQLARVVNKTNTNLTEAGYQVVRISGAQGQRLKVGLAQANSTSTCKDTLGLVTENISNNAEGFITTSGLVRGINTTGSLQGETWADGDRIYLSPSVAGGITNVEPSAPNIVIVLGYVVYAHANQGSIYVSVEGAKALHELFDVSIPTPTNNNVLVYESSTGLWKDKSISTILGYTPIANNATVGGELLGTLPNPSLVTSAVTGKALTGLNVSGSAVVSTDSILTGIGKLQNQINAVVGSVNFQGTWNASTNTPTLASGVGTKGYYYIVTVAGSTNLDGITDWKLGDWAIYDGTAWQKVDNTDAVVSVNGYTGIVTLAKADIGLGNVENTALSTWTGSGNITTVGTIGTGVWNGTAIGDTYISSASTWNAKIGGSGTTGRLAKFTSSGAVGDSIVSESSETIRLNGTNDIFINSNQLAVVNLLAGSSISGGGNFTIFLNDGIVGNKLGLAYWNGVNYQYALSVANVASGLSELKLMEAGGQIITFGAPDTGEAHIFGGSARVNGNLYSTATGNFKNISLRAELDDLESIYFGGIAATANFVLRNYRGAGTSEIYFNANGSTTINPTGGNVGIGTENPTAKFQIKQNANNVLGGLRIEKSDNDTSLFLYNNGSANLISSSYGSTGAYVPLYFQTSDLNRLVIDTNGNVGIGTTNTGYGNLGVYSASNTLIGIANSTSYAQLQQNSSDLYINTNLSGASGGNLIFRFGASSTEYMRITSSGNVGIGTTNPAAKLEILETSTSNPSLRLRYNASTIYGEFLMNNNGDFVIQTPAINGVTSGQLRLNVGSTNAILVQADGSIITNNAADTGESFIIGGSARVNGTLFTTGNITGGTVSAGVNVNLYSSSYGNNGLFNSYGTDGGLKFQAGALGNTQAYIYADTNVDMLLFAGANERMRITSGGNVGIGVTPSDWNTTALQMTNGISIFGDNSTPYGFISNNHAWTTTGDKYLVTGYGSSYYKQFDSVHSWATAPSGTAGGALTFTERMRITSTGNVGIGTTSPSEKLQINDGRLRFLESGQRQYNIGVASGTPDFEIYDATFGYTPFIVKGTGNVGIGTTSPASKLHIYSTTWNSVEPLVSFVNLDPNTADSNGLFVQAGADNAGAYIAKFVDYSGNEKFIINGAGAATFTSKITAGSSTETLNAFSGSNNSLFQATIYGYNYNASGYSFYSGQGKINFQSLPTSSAGLSTGDIWNDSGTLKIV